MLISNFRAYLIQQPKSFQRRSFQKGMLWEQEDSSMGLSSGDFKCPLFESMGTIAGNALLEPGD